MFLITETEVSPSVWHLHVQLLVILLKAGFNQPPELCPLLTPTNPNARA